LAFISDTLRASERKNVVKIPRKRAGWGRKLNAVQDLTLEGKGPRFRNVKGGAVSRVFNLASTKRRMMSQRERRTTTSGSYPLERPPRGITAVRKNKRFT